MIIDRALFRNGFNSELLTLETITQHEDYPSLKESLYCTTSNCNCRLIYIPEGLKIAHFKKWKGYHHINECPYYTEIDESRKPRRILGTRTAKLSDMHIRNILKDVTSKVLETKEERQARLRKQRARNQRKNIVNETQGKLTYEDIFVRKATTSLEGETIRDGEKSPSVKRRYNFRDFTLLNLEETFATGGTLKNILVMENFAIMTLEDKSQDVLDLYMEEAFFKTSKQNISKMLEGLEKLMKQEKISVACVGEVNIRDNLISMVIFSENNIRYNGQPLSTILFNSQRLF